MDFELLRYRVEGGVARVTMDRPDKLNSFNSAMALELQRGLQAAAGDREVRAVYLTGAGRAFCAGQDLAEALPTENDPEPDLSRIVRGSYNPIVRALRELAKPVVCGVNGVAAGAGANLAFACDIVIAARSARFIQSFSGIGLVPDTGGTFMLPRLVGLARATALTMLGSKLTAEQAVEIGLIHSVCDDDALQQKAFGMAADLATRPTEGFGLTKRLLNRSLSNDLDAQLELEAEYQGRAGRTEDYKEGVSAFLEKRAPKFTGS